MLEKEGKKIDALTSMVQEQSGLLADVAVSLERIASAHEPAPTTPGYKQEVPREVSPCKESESKKKRRKKKKKNKQAVTVSDREQVEDDDKKPEERCVPHGVFDLNTLDGLNEGYEDEITNMFTAAASTDPTYELALGSGRVADLEKAEIFKIYDSDDDALSSDEERGEHEHCVELELEPHAQLSFESLAKRLCDMILELRQTHTVEVGKQALDGIHSNLETPCWRLSIDPSHVNLHYAFREHLSHSLDVIDQENDTDENCETDTSIILNGREHFCAELVTQAIYEAKAFKRAEDRNFAESESDDYGAIDDDSADEFSYNSDEDKATAFPWNSQAPDFIPGGIASWGDLPTAPEMASTLMGNSSPNFQSNTDGKHEASAGGSFCNREAEDSDSGDSDWALFEEDQLAFLRPDGDLEVKSPQ